MRSAEPASAYRLLSRSHSALNAAALYSLALATVAPLSHEGQPSVSRDAPESTRRVMGYDSIITAFTIKAEPDSDTESVDCPQEETSSDTVLWTEPNTRKLISMYKQCPELWNAKHSKNNKVNREAKIAMFAKVFNTTTDEISRKLHNLRTQFSHQLRKIKKRMAQQDNGGVVTVAWDYFEDLSFLVPSSISSAGEQNGGVNEEVGTTTLFCNFA